VFSLGNLQLKLSVELILFLFIVPSVIRSIVVHHFWSQINKPFFNILDYFLAIVVKLCWVEIIYRLIHNTSIRVGRVTLVCILLIIIEVRLLRELSVRVQLLIFLTFSFVILNITLLFFYFVHNHGLELDNLILRFLISCFRHEISHN